MKNLLKLDDLSVGEIMAILKRAEYIQTVGWKNFKAANPYLSNYNLTTLFFEPSTRTQYSFLMAAQKLGVKIISFQAEGSSLAKKETISDTVKTFDAIGADLLVIRDTKENYWEDLTDINACVLNGGDGAGHHPTQSLLDLYTIYQEFKETKGLKVLIVGDIKHSRVAQSNFNLFERFGMEVKICAPAIFRTENERNISEYDSTISEYDVLLFLRYQYERHDQSHSIENKEFHKKWGLTTGRYEKLKPSAIVLHPAPVNWGSEISDQLQTAEKLRIFKQITNGVYIRAAIISLILEQL